MKQPVRQIIRHTAPKDRLAIGAALSALLLITGCATATFMVSKDCKTYYLGSSDERFHRMLCVSGDFEKVLIAAKFPQPTREAFQNAQCVERSREKVPHPLRCPFAGTAGEPEVRFPGARLLNQRQAHEQLQDVPA